MRSPSIDSLRIVKSRLLALERREVSLRERISQVSRKIDKERETIGVIELSREYYKKAIDLLYTRSFGEIQNLINTALQYVFYDKEYSVRLDLDFGRNKKELYITVLTGSGEKVREEDLKNGVGAGVRTVVSFVIHTYYILMSGAYPVLFLDEAYSFLSESYVGRFFELVDSLAKEKNFHIILISHDERFKDYASTKYVVSDGVYQEVT